MSQPLLRRRADSLSGTSSHQELIGNPPEAHEHHTRLRGVASQDFELEESDDNGSAAAGLDISIRTTISTFLMVKIGSQTCRIFNELRRPRLFGGKEVRGEVFLSAVKNAYEEVMHWKPNLFSIPLGAVGKKFVVEMTRLVRAFAEQSALESVSFWALMIMPSLLLQQPSSSSSHRQRGRLFTAPSQHLGVRKYQRSVNGRAGSAD